MSVFNMYNLKLYFQEFMNLDYISLSVWSFYHFEKSLLISKNTSFSDIIINTLVFLWLWFALFLCPFFTFKFYIYIYLKWVSCKQHTVDFCFLSKLTIQLWIGVLGPLILNITSHIYSYVAITFLLLFYLFLLTYTDFFLSFFFPSFKLVSSWRRKWQPTPVSLLGKSHGPRCLARYSPKGYKELDRTEHTHTD